MSPQNSTWQVSARRLRYLKGCRNENSSQKPRDTLRIDILVPPSLAVDQASGLSKHYTQHQYLDLEHAT
jgi:hypothetical protein